jgi:alkaline phosphatase D
VAIHDRTLARLSRRELIKIAWLLGAAAIAPPVFTRRVLAKPVYAAYPFALGVASGDPLPDGVVLWTRLAPEPLEGGGMPMAPVEVEWEIARDDRFGSIVQKGMAIARPELGHSVHV